MTEMETNGLSTKFIAQTEMARGYGVADHLKLHKLKDNRQLIFLARFQIQSYWSMILRRCLLAQMSVLIDKGLSIIRHLID